MLKLVTPKYMHFRESLIDSSIFPGGIRPRLGKSVTMEGMMDVENMIPASRSFYYKEKSYSFLDLQGTLKVIRSNAHILNIKKLRLREVNNVRKDTQQVLELVFQLFI